MIRWRVAIRGPIPSPRWLRRPLPQRETVEEVIRRLGLDGGNHRETIHPQTTAHNPLPENTDSLDDLPGDRGWWGYSFRDVPRRTSGATVIARIPHCRITSCRSDRHEGDFYPAICTPPSPSGDGSLDLREIRFRPMHTPALRKAEPRRRLGRATWITERVYDNHSHWLTAHLPKLVLLKERGELGDVLLPQERTPVIDASMRMAGIEPEDFPTFATGQLLEIDELTVLQTDRFHPELLRLVPQALGVPAAADPGRRIFISRRRAPRRRLVNEDDIWNMLQPAGFERICMEDLTFEQQAQLMGGASVVVAPHGAGLTNMLLCPPGARIVEIADLSFPNPNFYALACALGHRYWLIEAQPVGGGHPLKRNMRVDPRRLEQHLGDILAAPAAASGAQPAQQSPGAVV